MESVAFNTEGSNTSGCCYTYTVVKEKSQAVDQVRSKISPCRLSQRLLVSVVVDDEPQHVPV